MFRDYLINIGMDECTNRLMESLEVWSTQL
jgi:hypothetical protein